MNSSHDWNYSTQVSIYHLNQSLIGGTLDQGGPLLRKNRDFWDIKLQIFGTKDAENFQKLGILRKNWLFWSFKGKFDQILIIIVILDYFGRKNNSFFRFWKSSENFRNFWEIFRKKLPDIKLRISKIFEKP